MKTILKSVLTLTLAAGLGIAANAQTNVINTNVTASATILDALTLTKNMDISFGSISASTPGAVFLNPTGGANTNTGVNTTVGKFSMLGNPNSSVKVSWPATIILTGNQTPTASTISYGLLVHGFNLDVPLTSVSLGGQGVGTTAPVVLNPTGGTYFLYVGGGFPALVAKPTGIYTGIANFTVEYN